MNRRTQRKWTVCIILTKIEAVFFFLNTCYLTFFYLKYINKNHFIFCCFSKFPKKKIQIYNITKKDSVTTFLSQDISLKRNLLYHDFFSRNRFRYLSRSMLYPKYIFRWNAIFCTEHFSMEIFVKKDGDLTYIGFWYKIGSL